MDYGEPNKLDAARRAAAALGYLGLAQHGPRQRRVPR